MILPATIARRFFAVLALCILEAGGVTAAGLGAFSSGPLGGGAGGRVSSSGTGDAAAAGEGAAALGIGNFSRFPFRVTVSLQTGYDDNVFTSGFVAKGSAFTNGSLGLTYNFGSQRTEIEVRTGAGITYYWDRPEQPGPDYNAFLGLTAKHKFTARLTLDVTSYTTYQTEPDFSLNLGINRRSGSYFVTSDHFTLTYLFTPRFSTVTSYTFSLIEFENNTAGAFQNRIDNTVGNEFRYLILPTTSLVGEYRIGFTTYLDADAKATTHFLLAGFDHTFNPRLNATVRAGVEIREFDEATGGSQNGDRISPHIETTVTYALGARSNISWTNSYGIQEGDSTSSGGRTTFHTGLIAKYGVTPRITTQLALFYQHSGRDVQGGDTSEQDAIDAALSVRYALTRYLGVQVGYNYTDLSSDVFGRGYTRNRIYGGIDFIF
ncbi:MAG: hypothetical protein DLM52_01920 [Chthoniobacterales bacterium]|nr:MAG: hypothetical protein DLM52_01920 [Chthoniobacterales bacterium]